MFFYLIPQQQYEDDDDDQPEMNGTMEKEEGKETVEVKQQDDAVDKASNEEEDKVKEENGEDEKDKEENAEDEDKDKEENGEEEEQADDEGSSKNGGGSSVDANDNEVTLDDLPTKGLATSLSQVGFMSSM